MKIQKKMVKSDSNLLQKTLLEVLFSVSFKFFK